MRRAALIAFALSALGAVASAQTAPTAQAAFAERRALLEADRRCHLFTPQMRNTLDAAAFQARGALLRGGWTQAQLRELDTAAVNAARARRCGDARTEQAAARARQAFQTWSRTHAMNFPGGERVWAARRTPDPVDGWRLKQIITQPRAAAFGVREVAGAQNLALILPLAPSEAAPASAQMLLRNPTGASPMDAPGRLARGLEAGAPSPASSRAYLARARRVETVDGARRAVFEFPPEALAAMSALDPREAAPILLETGGRQQRLLIEIGDLAAARAFLAAEAS